MRVLVVDDEALARARLIALLRDLRHSGAVALAECLEASGTAQAIDLLGQRAFDAVLLDIRMPGADGLSLARTLRGLARPPELVFVTAHGEHAVQAFELEAADYLTKPVRLERLQSALIKVARRRSAVDAGLALQDGALWPTAGAAGEPFLLLEDRGQVERVALSQVLCVRAELKYLTVHTASRVWVHSESLHALEERYPDRLLRVHRSTLVSRDAMRMLERRPTEGPDGESWWLHLSGMGEPVAVSRRQLATVRGAMRRP